MTRFAVFSFLLIFLFESCASLTGYQDGRALGKNNSEIAVSLNMSQSPDLDGDNNGNSFYFPNFELYGKYGITDRLDVGGRLNTNTNFGMYAKYQLIGNRTTSPFALGVGGELGTFGLIGGSFWNAQLPLYTSFHTGKTAIYFSPRYIYQFGAGSGPDLNEFVSANYFGGNTGLIIGNKNKFCLDFGYYLLSGEDSDKIHLLTYGLGYKRLFGDLDENDNKIELPDGTKQKRKKRKRK
ncbi:MAG: hypothetical protein RLZZ546_1750 [Bacteroidota bacterium]|jgi:hypothetical protein